ncbi:MAG: ComF family protein, partial [Ignavibacteria bacterium]
MLKSIYRNLLDFVLPGICLCCEKILDSGTRFVCDECRDKLERFDNKFSSYEFTDYCLSLYKFVEKTEIQTIIHAFKYQQMKSIGNLFGREIGLEIINRNKEKFDYIIPVPLHRAKR